jgi:hypothetical protein
MKLAARALKALLIVTGGLLFAFALLIAQYRLR